MCARAQDLVLPTCLFAMLYLRYIAEDAESWDETKEHESLTTREEELIRDTSSVAFAALCAERPGDRWTVLQTLVDAEDAPRLLLARELTIEEKREFVDLRIEGWLRALPDALSRELRREWARLRELDKDELTLTRIEQLISARAAARQPRRVANEAVPARRLARNLALAHSSSVGPFLYVTCARTLRSDPFASAATRALRQWRERNRRRKLAGSARRRAGAADRHCWPDAPVAYARKSRRAFREIFDSVSLASQFRIAAIAAVTVTLIAVQTRRRDCGIRVSPGRTRWNCE